MSEPPYGWLNLSLTVGDDPAAVVENRRRAAAAFGVDPADVVWMDQQHGKGVTVVDGPHADAVPETDALVTAVPGLALAVLVADCVPVLLADDAHAVAAAVHAGRRGLARGVLAAALATMGDLGAQPEQLRATVGPAVCAGCYEVPAALRTEVCAAVPQAAARSRSGSPALDLRAGVVAALLEGGVRRIRVDNRCSAEDDELFSYRRDGVTGRFAGLVRLTSPAPTDAARVGCG